MRERPPDVDDADILDAVRRGWDAGVTQVEHLPVGFGAHHWAAYDDGQPRLFVTLDGIDAWRDTSGLEAAYSGAAALAAAGLEFVLAPLVSASGTMTEAFAGGRLSCAPWRAGESGGPLDVEWTRHALARLHAVRPPPGLARWAPVVGPELADSIEELVGRPWGPGPYAADARSAVRRHLGDLSGWVRRYHVLAAAAQERPWVVTHGEPHSDNQLLTADGRLMVDWDTLRVAPAEVDLGELVEAGAEVDADREMLELFDLQWRLDEISQYAAWFAAPHTGTRNDQIAFADLQEELARPDRTVTSDTGGTRG